jgi:hypothetical protein
VQNIISISDQKELKYVEYFIFYFGKQNFHSPNIALFLVIVSKIEVLKNQQISSKIQYSLPC